MSALNLVLYAGDELGPLKIWNELNYFNVPGAGFTTIIIGMFHIGDPDVAYNTGLGDIIFNGGNPILISGGGLYYSGAPTWASQIAALKANSVTKVYASFGGGYPVQDFATIKKIYEQNGNSFEGTTLQANLQLFQETFAGAFDGIDMDCEETYDTPSFVAFCNMLAGMGFGITFCPYTNQPFWNNALNAIQSGPYPYAVKWWNLQCYAGGTGNQPQTWGQGLPGGFIIPGDWACYWDSCAGSFNGDCPAAMGQLFGTFAGQSAVGGGFVYNLDLIRDTAQHTQSSGNNGCGGTNRITPRDYRQAVQTALGG